MSGPRRTLSPSSSQKAACDNLVLLGEFGRAHGLRGEVRLKSYTADPLAIAAYEALTDGKGRRFILTSVRQAAGDQPDLLVASVADVTTREGADALNRVGLYVDRAALAYDVEEDEFLLADLIGLAARDPDGAPLGTVAAVPNYGAGDLLEIAPERGPSVLVPFTKAFVPSIELPGRYIVIAAPDLFAPETDGLRDRPEDAS